MVYRCQDCGHIAILFFWSWPPFTAKPTWLFFCPGCERKFEEKQQATWEDDGGLTVVLKGSKCQHEP
jgi:DNA-directed RNA polymerase subunit RPC12/RpoP